MKRGLREIKKEVAPLLESNGITEYWMTHTKKHHRFCFRYQGKVQAITMSSTPRSDCRFNYVRQHITRIIKGAA